ncbi:MULTISPECIES: methyltransferase domain-containing protein [unclassified Roseitalea]|uniref:class I SAM-dependent methyltransferase n=1 Tax=unclassified Roseitalea TaxID=2639107 RepID=UPI00273E6653|nr:MULTISPECIES: methyltransferase domain-containing protein [unclassified Roseitalea]
MADRIRFLREMMRSPRLVGSITPTSRPTAAEMARHVDVGSGLPVLELGPGTGPVTAAILARGLAPDKLYAVEYSADLCAHLGTSFPDIHVINANAFDLDRALADVDHERFDSIVSGVPMLNFPQPERNALLNDALSRIASGRPFIQITYGTRPPIEPSDPAVAMRRSRRVLRNVPPASVWIYTRTSTEAR